MTDINQLLDELQDLVDDKRERVCVLFNRLREMALDVPRPMTLVFEQHGDFYDCTTPVGRYCYAKAGDDWIGAPNDGEPCSETEAECVTKLQSHFDAAWSAMTAKGAAT